MHFRLFRYHFVPFCAIFYIKILFYSFLIPIFANTNNLITNKFLYPKRIKHFTYMAIDKIDKLDKKILSILSTNARVPFKDVAAECGVSRAAVHQRVQHLTEDGIITGSGFNVNPKCLGFSTCTYVGINLERGSMYKEVVEHLSKIPEIVECHFTTGPYTMMVKLYARDNEQLMTLLNTQMQSIPGVVATETLISLEQSIKREIPVVSE